MPIEAFEDIALLGDKDELLKGGPIGDIRKHLARHEFGDTRHRVVDYRCRATTRFREYFHPALLASPGRPQRRRPGQARLDPELGTARRSPSCGRCCRCSAGRRRPSPSSRSACAAGAARACGSTSTARGTPRATASCSASSSASSATTPPAGESASQWGADPIWHGGGPPRRAISVELDQLFAILGRELPARPVRPVAQLPLVDLPRAPVAGVLGYRPEYDPARRLWFADIAIDPGDGDLAVRAARRRALPARVRSRQAPVAARALRLRPDPARAHGDADAPRRRPRARRAERACRLPRRRGRARQRRRDARPTGCSAIRAIVGANRRVAGAVAAAHRGDRDGSRLGDRRRGPARDRGLRHAVADGGVGRAARAARGRSRRAGRARGRTGG